MSSSWSLSKVAFVAFIVCFMLFFTIDAFTSHYSEKWIESIAAWLQTLSLFEDVVIYQLLSTFLLCLSFPTTALAFTGGYLFAIKSNLGIGITLSAVFNILSNVLCSTITYYLSLHMFDDNAEELVRKHKYMKIIQKSLQNRGMFINILMRLIPVLPSGIMNFSLAPLGVRFRDYIVGLLVGVTPYSIVFSALGACAAIYNKGISDFVTETKTEVLFVYAFLGLLGLIGLTYIIMRYVNLTLADLEQQTEDQGDLDAEPNSGDRTGYVPVSASSPNVASDPTELSTIRHVGTLIENNDNPLVRSASNRQKDEKKSLLNRDIYEL